MTFASPGSRSDITEWMENIRLFNSSFMKNHNALCFGSFRHLQVTIANAISSLKARARRENFCFQWLKPYVVFHAQKLGFCPMAKKSLGLYIIIKSLGFCSMVWARFPYHDQKPRTAQFPYYDQNKLSLSSILLWPRDSSSVLKWKAWVLLSDQKPGFRPMAKSLDFAPDVFLCRSATYHGITTS